MSVADPELDYVVALSLQEQFDSESAVEIQSSNRSEALVEEVKKRYDPRRIVDECWELSDPNPNIHDLFVEFDTMFFTRTLVRNGVEVKWSKRMTLCAGVCSYEGRGGLCSIRLSQPLLKLRPRKDLVETLLHEMIHAYLFVTQNNRDHDGHGPQFLSHMHRINKLTGAKITVYHSFHDEVNQYKQHWWKCSGPCQRRRPFYGLVKRAMNRAPSPNDCWWAEHQKTCGGTFTKIKEPDGYRSKKGTDRAESHKGKTSVTERDGAGSTQTILSFTGQGRALGSVHSSQNGAVSDSNSRPFVALSGRGLHDIARTKMLEAAEKRRELNQTRGITGKKRKKSSPPASHGNDIRKFCNTSLSKSSSPVKGPSLSVPDSKRARVTEGSSDEDDCVVVKEEEIVLDLTEDEHTSMSESESGPTSHMTSRDLRMCPVCGQVDIPVAIINAHVAFCLDEDIQSRTID